MAAKRAWKTGLFDITAEPNGTNRWCACSPLELPHAHARQPGPTHAGCQCGRSRRVSAASRALRPRGGRISRGPPPWHAFRRRLARQLANSRIVLHLTGNAACTRSRARRAPTAAWLRTPRRRRACRARCVAPGGRASPRSRQGLLGMAPLPGVARGIGAPNGAPARRSACSVWDALRVACEAAGLRCCGRPIWHVLTHAPFSCRARACRARCASCCSPTSSRCASSRIFGG